MTSGHLGANFEREELFKLMAYRDSVSSVGSKRDSLWDPGLQSVFDNESGTRIMSEVAAKRKIRKARLLFEASTQSQPPSKDFVSLVITEIGIIWSKWKITLRGFTSGAAPIPQPQEEVMTITDFKCNDTLLDEVKRAFGNNTFNHIERIIYGSNDPLSCTPEALMIRICSMLDLQSISQLSQVNRYLRNLCASEKLWGLLYAQHQGNPTAEICVLANDVGWKKVFYLSKLQLQKELSRRRSQYSAAKLAAANASPPRASTTSEKNTLFPKGSPTSDKNSPVLYKGSISDPRGSTSSENQGETSLPRESVTGDTAVPSGGASVRGSVASTTGADQDTFLTENA